MTADDHKKPKTHCENRRKHKAEQGAQNKSQCKRKNSSECKIIGNDKPKPYFVSSGEIIGVYLSYFDSVFYFETNKQKVKFNDSCIVNTEKGIFLGKISTPARKIPDKSKKHFPSYGKIIRIAKKEDLIKKEKNEELERKGLRFCTKRANARNLEMKLVKVLLRFDRSKATFLFTADGRVDFRDLVKDLAGEFHTRIEMKQIGVRDEARMYGGYGCCGRLLCCSAYQKDFVPVSIRMAKVQGLTLDPGKISGSCGRLMCCLEYEYSTYEDARKELPKVGERVRWNSETGKILNIDILNETASIEVGDGKIIKAKVGSFEVIKHDKK